MVLHVKLLGIMCKVIITQPNYIPWKGYFSNMRNVDYLVIYDDVQYTKRDWRNRNYLITNNGPSLISIPVITKGRFYQKINETKVSDKNWYKKHWKFIENNYKKTKFYNYYSEIFYSSYHNIETDIISEIDLIFIKKIIELLGLNIKILKSSELNIIGDRNTRLLNICNSLNCSTYVSAPAAKSYLNENLFKENNIQVEYYNYNKFKEYKQNWNGFDHKVSILDMFFNLGPETVNYFNET